MTWDTDAVVVGRVAPVYPAAASKRAITGWVTVVADVSETGAVIAARVCDSKPVGIFDKAALNAIQRFEYEPATSSGMPVSSSVLETFRFEIER